MPVQPLSPIEAEIAVNQMIAALRPTKEAWAKSFELEDGAMTGILLKGLQDTYPPFETLTRLPNIMNLLSTWVELMTGRKIIWRLGKDEGTEIIRVVGCRFEDAGRPCMNRPEEATRVQNFYAEYEDEPPEDDDDEDLDDPDEGEE